MLAGINHILDIAEFTDGEVNCWAECNADGYVNVFNALAIVNVI